MSSTLLNYQQVLEQLQESANKIADVTELLENQSALVLNHNEDNNAHAYIQQRINEISTLNPVMLTNAIAQHDNSTTSHAGMRQQLTQLSTQVQNIGTNTTITQNINTAVSTHSSDGNAHADIRALISNATSSANFVSTVNERISNHSSDATAHPVLISQMNTLFNSNNTLSANLQSMQLNIANINATVEEIINGGGGTGGTISMVTLTTQAPSIIKPSGVYTLSFAGVSSTGTVTFSINAGTSGLVFSKTSNIAVSEAVTMTVPAGATRGTVVSFTVTASDGTESGYKIVSCAINRLPDTSGVLFGIPAVVTPNGAYNVTLTGSADLDGQTLSYSIASNKSYVTFSKNTGIASGEVFTVNYSAAATRGETPTFTVTVTDGLESATKTITTGMVNTLPSSDTVTSVDIPVTITAGTANSFTLSGGSDASGGSLTYMITGGAGLNITPTTNITPGTNIVMNPSPVTVQTVISFTVFTVDSTGEVSGTGKVFSVTVDPQVVIPVVQTPTILAPTNNAEITLPYTVLISPYAVV